MRAQLNVSISASVAEALRVKAAATGAGIGDLAELCLRYGLERLRDDAVRAHVLTRAQNRGRLAGALTKDERSVLNAFERLEAAEPGAERFALSALASEAGLRLTAAFWALKALQSRGVANGAELDETDRWGRPVRSFWTRKRES